MKVRRWLATAVLAVLALAQPASAQIPDPPAPPAEPQENGAERPSKAAILDRRAEIRRQIENLRQRTAAGEEVEFVAEELSELERAGRLLDLELGELRRAEKLVAGVDRAAGDPDPGPQHPPPYSLAELDAVLDDQQAAAAAAALVEEQVAVSRRAVDSARDQLDAAEQRLRLARDQAVEPSATQRRQLRWFELQVRSAEIELRLRRLELDNARRDLELQGSRAAALERSALRLRSSLVVSDEERQTILAGLAERGAELERELAAARERTARAEDRLAAAEAALPADAEGRPARVAAADARRLEVDAAQIRQEVLSLRRERVERLDDLWRLRFRAFAGELAASDLAVARKSLEADLEKLERTRRLAAVQLAERRLFLRQANERLAAATAALLRPIGDQGQALEQMVALYEDELVDLERAARQVRRVQGEVAALHDRISLGEHATLVGDRIAAAWRTEITTADGRPITVGKLVLAFLLILLGFFLSRAASRRLGRAVFPRLGLTPGAALAFQTLVFYTLLVVFVLWALRLVGIPLTFFTVLGGVLAIGLGFGSQNIVNNFISGLIILAEHPIKVGDLIEVDGVFGKVERIGPRSSQIRSGDNTHIIVPNSAFLEKNVLNWTVSDDVVRSTVDVGVAYGSPVETVAELLERAVAEEPSILAEPAPEVLFSDFGDNALAFRAYFWVRVARPLDRQRAQSRLRFRIDALFRDADIVIAFPQRDVHLDSLAPLEVRLVGGSEAAADG